MKQKYLFLIGLLLIGCHQERLTETQTNGQKATVSKGMSIEDAVALVRNEGLSMEESTPAVAHDDENVAVTCYRIEPTNRPKDALFLVTHSREGEGNEIIEEIFWHLDYDHDSTLPKTERKDEYQSLSSIDLRSLKDTKAE